MRVAQAREVVEQGVEPDVGDVAVVEGQGDAPIHAALGPGDAQVLQGLLEKSQHLVLVAFRADPVGVGLDVVDEPVLVFAHAEEVVFFLEEGGDRFVVRAAAVHQVPLQVKALAAEAIEPAVLPEVNVPGVVHPLQDLLHHAHVGRVGGADVVVVADIQAVPGPAEAGADLVHEVLDRQAHGGGGFQDLVAVFVGAGLEAHLLPQEAVAAGQGISHHRGVGVADVGLGVDVIDGRGEVDSHDSEQ